MVLLSEGTHWVGNDGALGLERCMDGHGIRDAAAWSQRWVAKLYGQQMARNAEFLRTVIDASGNPASVVAPSTEVPRRTRVFFRTMAPGYPPEDVLRPDTRGGGPPVYREPSRTTEWVDVIQKRGSAPFNHHMIPALNALARRAYLSASLNVMDVAQPMEYRVDGHLDRLHYCLPGPVDFYSEALWNYMLE